MKATFPHALVASESLLCPCLFASLLFFSASLKVSPLVQMENVVLRDTVSTNCVDDPKLRFGTETTHIPCFPNNQGRRMSMRASPNPPLFHLVRHGALQFSPSRHYLLPRQCSLSSTYAIGIHDIIVGC